MDYVTPAAEDIDGLRTLADKNGVSTFFWDWYGQRRDVSAHTLLEVLKSLGVGVGPESSVHDLHDALAEVENREWRRVLPATIVARQGQRRDFPVHVPDGTWVRVSWIAEDGRSGECVQLDRWVPPRSIDGALVGRATFEIPDHLPSGWHRIVATLEGGQVHSTTLLIAPNRCHGGATADGKRRWGVAAQLYSTRSTRSWGLGDAEDLADLAALAADRGADFLLINPIHASAPIAPLENSPYLPVSRRWLNPIYIRPEMIDEYSHASLAVVKAIEELRVLANSSDTTDALVDRDRSWEAKRRALEMIFPLPRSYHREAQFQHFITEGGEDLRNFATWCALVEANESMILPEEVASSSMPQSDRARLELADRVEFWQWCQWIVAEQMEDAQRVAKSVGMDIGMMADLAVGVHPQGSEVWSRKEVFAPGMSVGAPPDMYSQQGQDWSEPPWSPRALAEAGYQPLRDMLRASLKNAGAIRIDHILGLFRLWWIPAGKTADQGTYVYYDHEAMLGAVLIEAERAGAVVIGEDLGTVEPWVRDYLRERGVLGTSILWFEKDEGGWPLHPEAYRRECLAAVNTHDLPPTAGYMAGVQTTLRHELGLLVDDVESVRAQDRLELEQVSARLREYSLLESVDPSEREFVEALHAYVSRTPSLLVVAALVDAVGDRHPQNLPGTNREYPNWCVPLCDDDGIEVLIDALPTNPRLNSLFSVMNAEMKN